ncbi:MAG: iron-containing alcohol dehydrogenase [Candidatus Promineifilaceae bacterium]|nr:iron-containing alcohol dehydrogenase [Candidatus Promineifilaceae bacterium]
MWFFKCPEYYFGQGALGYLSELHGERAFIVTDENILELGFVDLVRDQLTKAGISSHVFAEVEPNPSLDTVQRGAEALQDYQPDWIIGLGGGSCMDASQAMWILYENPTQGLELLSPWSTVGLRQKARLITIPTTAGSGAESSYAMVLTDTEEERKLTLAVREVTPDLAIVDPRFTANLPQQITADTGIDVLSHALEAYSCTWANDFTDGLCLQAARMVFKFLPRAVFYGAEDEEARERMANAATIAGITLGNSSVALGHTMGHTAGAHFKHIPHGRITAIFVPYTLEFVGNSGEGRYRGLARALNLRAADHKEAAFNIAGAMRFLMHNINLPTSLKEAGISLEDYENALPQMVENAETDANLLQSRRIPETEEMIQLFRYAYEGNEVDF